MLWHPSLTQVGLLVDVTAAWILFSDKFGYERLDHLDQRLETLSKKATLSTLASREWLLDPDERRSNIARHLLVLLTFALTATLILQREVINVTAVLGLADVMGSIAGAWSTTSALVPEVLFGLSLLALYTVLFLFLVDLERLSRRETMSLVTVGVAAALPVVAVMWPVLIPLGVFYGLCLPVAPVVQWLPLAPLHVGRWVKDHGGPDRVLPGAGMALLSAGFGLQFLATL